MQRFNAKLFTWDAARKTCATEISDLGRNINVFAAVSVYSPRTGDDTHWGHVRTLENKRENEIEGWVLAPLEADVKRFPHLEGWEMIIFND